MIANNASERLILSLWNSVSFPSSGADIAALPDYA